MKRFFWTMAFALTVWVAPASHTHAGCECSCRRPDGTSTASVNFPSVSNPEEYPDRCRQMCWTRGSNIPAGSCMHPLPSHPPFDVDFCSQSPPPAPWTSATFKGNNTGLTARRAGTSCFNVPINIERFRVWCHVWIENRSEGDPSREGFCHGFGESSCGPVGWIDRQRFSYGPVDANTRNFCVHVNNQHSTETRHFSVVAEPY